MSKYESGRVDVIAAQTDSEVGSTNEKKAARQAIKAAQELRNLGLERAESEYDSAAQSVRRGLIDRAGAYWLAF